MAQLEYNDTISSLIQDMESFSDDISNMGAAMLKAEADLVEPALKQSIASEGLVRTGRLQGSIGRTVRHKGKVILLGPTGDHHRYVTRSGKAGALRAGHLGYILEHGLPRRNILGRKWMSKAVQKTQGRALDAAEKVRDEYLKKHNL